MFNRGVELMKIVEMKIRFWESDIIKDMEYLYAISQEFCGKF